MRRAQTDKLVEVQCEKGALGEEKGVAPELPAGSQCPELAQHVDTEPGPDLKSPFLPEGKRWRDSRIRATSASWSLVYFFFFSLWSHWLTALFSFSLFLVFDFFFFCDIGFSSYLGRHPSCLLPSRERSDAECCPWTCQECSVSFKDSSAGWKLVNLNSGSVSSLPAARFD